MLTVALVLAALAALLHVYIFALEALAWNTPRGRATFGTTREQARATQELAYNQGFYNLFLALVTTVGVVLMAASTGPAGAGPALIYAGAGSMLLAAVVLVTKNRAMARAAVVQGTAPALALTLLTVVLLMN
ncbi:DUF1304 domain-containing protein [Ruania alba]|uniref:Putative membrane protein n=1 Tax=Ruania alba TaxID=648782 RepID=A0A1H5CD84_9MICO|nr:DUF1304 domain-containing protein [Ruania alba]SED64545.1 putative membrane protein [Ruania alba]